jgi:enamine deaminase RidA (YjgF/YER057c/UK114 family)
VKASLEAAGSSLDKVVKILWMLKDIRDYPTMRRAELDYYLQHAPQLVSNPPTSTTMQLPSITSPRAKVQLDVTAVLYV